MEELTEKFYSVKEAANLLKVHYQTVRNWIVSGKLRAVKVGLSYRIPKSEIERNLTGSEPANG